MLWNIEKLERFDNDKLLPNSEGYVNITGLKNYYTETEDSWNTTQVNDEAERIFEILDKDKNGLVSMRAL